MIILQRKGHPIWHGSHGNRAAMWERHCYVITRLLVQNEETGPLSPKTLKNSTVFRKYWYAAAPTLTRASCKSVKNLPKFSKRLTTSDRLLKYSLNMPNFCHAINYYFVCFRMTKNYFQALSCHRGIPDAMFVWGLLSLKAQEVCFTLFMDVTQFKYIFFPTYSCCSIPIVNNVMTEVAEWNRPQLSF